MSVERLDADEITAMTCDDVQEGRTLALEVGGDQVVVARITQLQTGKYGCPVEDCVRRFDSRRGRSTHLGKMHPDVDLRPECAECGDRYEPTHPDQIYCSRDCYHSSGQTTLECDECGEEFVTKESHADGKRFCSQDCYDSYLEEREPSTEERDCETCGETFEVYPSQDQRFCSCQCAGQARAKPAVEKECPTCGSAFETYPSNDCTYCSRECFYEDRREDPRPDELRALLYDLYVVDDFDVETALDRVEAIRGSDLDVDRDELKARILAGEPWLATVDELPSRVTAPEVYGVACRSDTLLEVQQALRRPRNTCSAALSAIGMRDEVGSVSANSDIAERARDRLGIGDDGKVEGTDDPVKQYRSGVST